MGDPAVSPVFRGVLRLLVCSATGYRAMRYEYVTCLECEGEGYFETVDTEGFVDDLPCHCCSGTGKRKIETYSRHEFSEPVKPSKPDYSGIAYFALF